MDSFVQQMEQNYGIRAAYVASKGIQSDDNAKRTEVGKYDDSEVKAFEAERNTLNKIDVTGEELREIVAALAEKRASKIRKMILDEWMLQSTTHRMQRSMRMRRARRRTRSKLSSAPSRPQNK